MNDFKLKLILSILTGLVFSFIFIILAFVLPSEEKFVLKKKTEGRLGEVSQSVRKHLMDD